MKATLALAIALMLFGCSADDLAGPSETGLALLPAPEGEPRVIVHVVDEAGQPFRPDQAWWYYAPGEQGRAGEYEARCADDGCTRWAVTGATDGRVYVAASYQREHPDSYCLFGGYDAMPVEVETGAVPEVTLRLEEAEMCE